MGRRGSGVRVPRLRAGCCPGARPGRRVLAPGSRRPDKRHREAQPGPDAGQADEPHTPRAAPGGHRRTVLLRAEVRSERHVVRGQPTGDPRDGAAGPGQQGGRPGGVGRGAPRQRAGVAPQPPRPRPQGALRLSGRRCSRIPGGPLPRHDPRGRAGRVVHGRAHAHPTRPGRGGASPAQVGPPGDDHPLVGAATRPPLRCASRRRGRGDRHRRLDPRSRPPTLNRELFRPGPQLESRSGALPWSQAGALRAGAAGPSGQNPQSQRRLAPAVVDRPSGAAASHGQARHAGSRWHRSFPAGPISAGRRDRRSRGSGRSSAGGVRPGGRPDRRPASGPDPRGHPRGAPGVRVGRRRVARAGRGRAQRVAPPAGRARLRHDRRQSRRLDARPRPGVRAAGVALAASLDGTCVASPGPRPDQRSEAAPPRRGLRRRASAIRPSGPARWPRWRPLASWCTSPTPMRPSKSA